MCNDESTTTSPTHSEDAEEIELIDLTDVVDLTGNNVSSQDDSIQQVDVTCAPSSNSSREENLRNLLLHRKRLAEELEANRSREEELRQILLMRKKRRDGET